MKKFTAIYPDKIRYDVLVDVIQTCGKAHNPRSFAIDVLHNINRIVDFDQALCFFIDANGKCKGQYLNNVDEKWLGSYMNYYKSVEDKKFDYFQMDIRENPNCPTINVHDWTTEESKEFIPYYINQKGLKYSCGFALYDLYGQYRMVFSLDRLSNNPFRNEELYNLQQAVIMLNDLNKNFFYRGQTMDSVKQKTWADAKLTAREIEIVDLLMQGISPANISKILYISTSTTYKHIAHIYEKLNVNSQQELLVKLMNS